VRDHLHHVWTPHHRDLVSLFLSTILSPPSFPPSLPSSLPHSEESPGLVFPSLHILAPAAHEQLRFQRQCRINGLVFNLNF
jgi:hypothetical protein